MALRQEFVFQPNPSGKVVWTDARDTVGPADVKCIRHLQPGSTPHYPRAASRELWQGTLLAYITFESATAPPTVTIAETGAHPHVANAVREWAVDYRWPCFSGKPLRAHQFFKFRLENYEGPRLNNTTLQEFLKAAKEVSRRPVYFDLGQMKCPFAVRLHYYQPAAPHRIVELGDVVPARRPFLDWLATLRFATDPKTENALLGSSMTLDIPCAKIDL